MESITIPIYCKSPQRRKVSHRASVPVWPFLPTPPSLPSVSARGSNRKLCCSFPPVFIWTAQPGPGIQPLRLLLFLPISLTHPGEPCCYRWLHSWGWEHHFWVYLWSVPWFQCVTASIFLFPLSAISASFPSSALTGSPSPFAESPHSRSSHWFEGKVAKALEAEVAPRSHRWDYSVLNKGYLFEPIEQLQCLGLYCWHLLFIFYGECAQLLFDVAAWGEGYISLF